MGSESNVTNPFLLPLALVTYRPGFHYISLSQEDRGVHGPYLGTGERKAAEDLKP